MADDWVVPHDNAPAPAHASGVDDWTMPEGHAAAPDHAQSGGTFENIMAGVNDTIAHGIGSPVDLANHILGLVKNVGTAAVNVGRAAAGDYPEEEAERDLQNIGRNADFVQNPVGGSEFIKQQMGRIGANPDEIPINGDSDRIARAVGAGVLMMAAPEMFGKDAPGLISSLLRAGRTAPAGALSGAGGEIARENAPDNLKPLAEIAGSVAGGGAGALATEGPQFAAKQLLGPVTEGGARRTAAGTLANSAIDLDAVKAALDKGNNEIVPGSRPTTFQATGDMGLGALERASQTDNPVPFNERRAGQNTARRTVLDQLQASGDPAALSGYIKSRIAWLDQQTQADVENATKTAQQQTEALGGNQHPEVYGAKLRDMAATARASAKEQESKLWQAIDPDGNLTVAATPISETANAILSGLPKTAKPVSGEESGTLTAALSLGNTAPFSEVAALRSRVNDALNEELTAHGRTQTYARLSRLRGAIEDGINGAVDEQAHAEPEKVLKGLQQLRQDAANFSGRQRASNQNAGAADVFGTGDVFAGRGTEGQGNGQSGTAAGGQNGPLPAPFDEAARARLAAANAATRARVDTFDSGTVGQILRNSGRSDQYRVPDATVGTRLFRPGVNGAQDVQAYIKAAGPDQAIPTLTDYAAMSLRRAAGRDDGTLDPGKATTWLNLHRDALRALPDNVSARFQNAQTASDVVADTVASRKRILDEYQAGTFAKLAGLDNADDVTRVIGNVLGSNNRVQQMQALATQAGRNPDALAGLRKSVADYISNRFVGNTEAAATGEAQIKSDQFQTFMKQNGDALRAIFTGDEVQSMQSVAADLQRSNRSLNAAKIPGQSNTAQDIAAKGGIGKQSILSRATAGATREAAAAGAGGAMALGGAAWPVAVATWLGARTLATLRAAGIQRANDLVREALLNPDFARTLLKEAPTKTDAESSMRIRNALARSGIVGIAAPQPPPLQ